MGLAQGQGLLVLPLGEAGRQAEQYSQLLQLPVPGLSRAGRRQGGRLAGPAVGAGGRLC